MARLEPHDIHWFTSTDELRGWLDTNHATAAECWVGLRPKASGLPTVTWPALVDELLCVGWIDGVRMPADGGSCIRVTPRRPGSIWSARNIGRVEALRLEGRMRPEGEAAFAARRDDRTAVYSFENGGALDDASRAALDATPGARSFWEAQPPSYRRIATHWVTSARRDETRARRRAALVAACEQGERLPQFVSRPRRTPPGLREPGA
jgi:uncharacterized protein YdeI (YjbR/CyaY-like superfamily)